MKDTVINVLGTEYSVKFKELKGQDIDGYTDNTSKEIVIRSDNSNNIRNFLFLQQ